AWTENWAHSERIAFQVRLRGERCAGRSPVLWLGWRLQHSSVGARWEVARTQGRQYRKAQARRDRCRQYRLHDADRGGHDNPGGSYDRADRLGDRGPRTRDAHRDQGLCRGGRDRRGDLRGRKGQERCSPRSVLVRPHRNSSRNDREADHGEESEEVEGEERQEGEEGRSGPQEEKGSSKESGEEGAGQEGEAAQAAGTKARSGAKARAGSSSGA